jgi:hypothetical protein
MIDIKQTLCANDSRLAAIDWIKPVREQFVASDKAVELINILSNVCKGITRNPPLYKYDFQAGFNHIFKLFYSKKIILFKT